MAEGAERRGERKKRRNKIQLFHFFVGSSVEITAAATTVSNAFFIPTDFLIGVITYEILVQCLEDKSTITTYCQMFFTKVENDLKSINQFFLSGR